jgi:hypothetical protein
MKQSKILNFETLINGDCNAAREIGGYSAVTGIQHQTLKMEEYKKLVFSIQ